MTLSDFIKLYLKDSVYSPVKNKRFLCGRNGPYQEIETPLRTMMNFAVLVDKFTLASCYPLQVKQIESYCSANLIRGNPGIFRNSSKDTVNGLIGPAWTIEGLLSLYNITKKHEFLDYCKTLADKYEIRDGIINNIVHCDGSSSGQDLTLNHQLWLAAALSNVHYLCNDFDNYRRAKDLFIRLTCCDALNRNGHLYHLLKSHNGSVKEFAKRVIKSEYRTDMLKKEAGYHAFNLLSFFIISDQLKNDGALWHLNTSTLSRKVLIRAAENSVIRDKDNRYSSTYNPIGIEYAVVFSHLNDEENMLKYLNMFFENYMDLEHMSVKANNDPVALSSRLYELSYVSHQFKNRLVHNGRCWGVSNE